MNKNSNNISNVKGHSRRKRTNHKKIHKEKFPSSWLVDRLVPFPPPGSFNEQPHNFVDSLQNLAYFTTSTVSNTFGGTFFALSSMNDASEYAAVFDQYRIMAVEITIMPSTQTVAGLTGHLLSAVDYDDVSTISPALNAQKSTVVISNLQDTIVRSFTPRIALAAYSGAFTAYSVGPSQSWINTASPTVQHYGHKLTANPTATAITYDLYTRVWFQFRNQV
jgi:hypothetical protein